ncbi:ras-domain-containing protein [Clavulina sp. PMI_390]|nr:ras-domain-containing protein [Clavulina sp. PMI_390]
MVECAPDVERVTELTETYDFLMKIIIIGESGTGKSCLLHHFIQGSFKEHAQHTIGVEFSSRVVRDGDRRIKLQLWDTAGQERFRSVTRSYYRGAAGAILVFDITNRATFTSLQRWLDDARALASPFLVTTLVGAKSDREEDRQVSWAEASRWAEEREIHYLELSALSSPPSTIAQPFLFITRSILLSIESGALDPDREPGCGVSYGDRVGGYYGFGLRRKGSRGADSFGAESGGSGRLSVLLGTSTRGGQNAAAKSRWPSFGRRGGGRCC